MRVSSRDARDDHGAHSAVRPATGVAGRSPADAVAVAREAAEREAR
jgi:hypothetical protein